MLALISSILLAVIIPSPAPSHVVDTTGSVSGSDLESIARGIQKVQQRNDMDLAVVMIPSLEGEDPQVVAKRVYTGWSLRSRGVLLLIAKSPGKLIIQPGLGLDSAFQEDICKSIIQSMVPMAKAGDFNDAIRQGLKSITTRVEQVSAPRAVASQPPPSRFPLPTTEQRNITNQVVIPSQQASSNGPVGSEHPLFTAFLIMGLALFVGWLVIRTLSSGRRTRSQFDMEPEYTPIPPSRSASYRNAPVEYGPISRIPVTVAPQVVVQQQVTQPANSGVSDIVTGMVLNEALHHHESPPAPPVRYDPLPPSPEPSRKPLFGSGGGSSSVPSSDDFGSGGGSSSFGGSSDFGGGGGSSDLGSNDSSGGSGGGSADF